MLSCDIKIRDINFSVNLLTIYSCQSSKRRHVFVFILQNEDNNHGREAEQGADHLGTSCPRGPQGPVGAPGIEVGSSLFSNTMVTLALQI